MRRFLYALLFCLSAMPAHGGTRLFAFYGLGGPWFSTGVDQVVEQARNIPGVTHIATYNYWETNRAVRDIDGVPSSDKVVLFGYSCGANSTTVVAYGVHRHINTVAGIQQSLWCGGTDLYGNVSYGQMTYNPTCWQTGGLGCKPYTAGSGFTGHILNIERPDMHGYADENPDAQRDVLLAIALTAHGRIQRVHCGQHVCVIVRRHGEAP